jgi:hypothetical protein
VIQRLCAFSLIVLIVLPFTAPFETFDPIDFSARGHASRIADTVSPPASATVQDDAALWFERSEVHHSMELSRFTTVASYDISIVVRSILLPAPAVISQGHDGMALAGVLRV